MSTTTSILSKIGADKDLPSLAPAVSRIIAALDDENSSADDVAELIAADMAISGRVLRLANSAIYNAAGQNIASVNEAIPRLGFREIRNIVLATGVIDVFRDLDCPFDYRGFWKHCLTTAIAAGMVAQRAPKINHSGTAGDNPYFVAGLMHDVGIFVLVRFLRERYSKVLMKAETEGRALYQVERESLGFDHMQVGAELIREWGLPDAVADAAEHHHHPGTAPQDHRIWAVVIHLADWIADHEGHGLSVEGALEHFVDSSWYELGLEIEAIPELIEDFAVAADRSDMMLALSR